MAALNLAELPEDEFMAFVQRLKSPVQTNDQTSATLPPTVTPEMQESLAQAGQVVQTQLPRDFVGPEAKRLGMRPGVFLNIERGAPKTTRARLGLDENQINQFKLLVEQYGPGNVDLNDDGRFIIRNQPSDVGGGTEDILVDPIGFEGGDIAQIGGQALPIAAGVVGARFGGRVKGSGLKRVVSGALGAAGAQHLTGFGQDAFVRWLENNEVDFTDIAKARAKTAAFDTAIGLAFAGAGKVASKALEGVLGALQIPIGSTATSEAQKALLRKTGVDMPLSIGEATESPLLRRVENIARGRPGSASVIDNIRELQQNAEDEFRRVFHGLPRTMPDEELAKVLPKADLVGQKALRAIGKEAEAIEGKVVSATEDLLQTGTKEAQALANVDLLNPLDVTKVGERVLQRVSDDFTKFRSDMSPRYEAFLSKPEIQNRIVDGTPIAKTVAEIEKKFTPEIEKQVTKQSPILDEFGRTQEVTGSEVKRLESVIPPKVAKIIQDLKQLDNAKVSINSLKLLRTGVDDAIAEGLSIAGTDVAQLKALHEAVDTGITKSLGNIDKNLLDEWEKLSTDYSKGINRFDKVGIRNLLVKQGERGSIGPAAAAERILGNSPEAIDNYNAYKEFFGETSTEFQLLKQNARQNILTGAISDVSGYIKGSVLRARLANTRPEVARELFGSNKEELHRIGELLSRGQGNLDTAELVKLASSQSLTATKLAALETAERERAVAFNNKLINAARKGQVDAEKIKPSEFVRYASQMDPADAERVMGLLSSNPELTQEIRQLAIEDIWSRIRAGAFGKKRISPSLLSETLGTESAGKERTWRVMIGNDTVDQLQDLLKVIANRESGQEFSGNLAGQSDIARIALGGEVGAVKEMASRFLIATIYAGPARRAFINMFTSQDRGRMLNAIISSTPFIEAGIARFGTDGFMPLMAEYRNMVEPISRRELMVNGEIEGDPSTLSEDEFQAWLLNLGAKTE